MKQPVNGVTIAQTGTAGANVGRMAIDVKENGDVAVSETLLSRDFFDNIAPDPAVTQTINEMSSHLDEKLKTDIGETKNTLWGGSIRNTFAEGRVGETNLGSLICDAMITEAEEIIPSRYKNNDGSINIPIVAIENGGGYRASIPNGRITIGSIVDTLPFSNTVQIKEITPSILYAALEDFVSSVTKQDPVSGLLDAKYSGSFPQIGGMTFSYDPNSPEHEKIKSVSIGNKDIERSDTQTPLILASNDYVMTQSVFKDIPMIAEGDGLTDVVISYIKSLIAESEDAALSVPVTMGRIFTTAHDPDNYTYNAHITLTNAEGLDNGSTLAVYVDGKLYEKPGTVTDGVLVIELPDGPHAVKLFPEQAEAYVNNYSGNGVLYENNGIVTKYPELEYDEESIKSPVG